MEKILLIDLKILKEMNLSINEFLVLYNIYNENALIDIANRNEMLLSLQDKKLVKMTNEDDVTIRQTGIDIISYMLIDSETIKIEDNKKILRKSSRTINTDIDIIAYRNLWKGLKPGSMGSKKSCEEKLTRWMKENPEYSFEDIMKAAKLYLSTEGRNIRFLQRADYFVFKREPTGEEMSRLSAFIDEADLDSSDWTSTLR